MLVQSVIYLSDIDKKVNLSEFMGAYVKTKCLLFKHMTNMICFSLDLEPSAYITKTGSVSPDTRNLVGYVRKKRQSGTGDS